jgi:sulfite reductase alpha subunit-like flavoprotein
MDAGELASSFDLLGDSSSIPVSIYFASDGGNAESVAKRLEGEAKKRGLRVTRCMTMNDAAEDMTKISMEENTIWSRIIEIYGLNGVDWG